MLFNLFIESRNGRKYYREKQSNLTDRFRSQPQKWTEEIDEVKDKGFKRTNILESQ